MIHYSRVPFQPVCRADIPNQATSQILAHVTCEQCIRFVEAAVTARLHDQAMATICEKYPLMRLTFPKIKGQKEAAEFIEPLSDRYLIKTIVASKILGVDGHCEPDPEWGALVDEPDAPAIVHDKSAQVEDLHREF